MHNVSVAGGLGDTRTSMATGSVSISETPVDSQDGGIVGRSGALDRAKQLALRAASTGGRVLIWGKTGTGKELFARFIHDRSKRCEGPFVSMNCAAIPEGLVESILFGHERGAFTGAHTTTNGKFEDADGGTLFLDEVGDLALPAQAKVLRVFEDGEIAHVGGRKKIRVYVRIVAATHRNLWKEVVAGRFRKDLFYRLNVVTMRLPSLRERQEDIPLLVDFFLKKILPRELQLDRIPCISMAAVQELMTREWEGNVRELRNVLERAVTLYHDSPILEPEHFEDPLEFWMEPTPGTAETALGTYWAKFREQSRAIILNALAKNGGNRTQTAKELGITARTIRNHLARERRENKAGQAAQ